MFDNLTSRNDYMYLLQTPWSSRLCHKGYLFLLESTYTICLAKISSVIFTANIEEKIRMGFSARRRFYMIVL